jgi:prefoldin subunit 5
MLRMDKVNVMLRDLYSQQCDLSQRESELKAAREAEQRDVDRLENGSLAAFLYAAIGQKEKKLDQERREALAAAVKHDTVLRQLNAVRLDIEQLERERDKLNQSAAEYRRVLEEKQRYLLEKDPVHGKTICTLQEKLGYLANQQREVQEAITAGNAVLRQLQTVKDDLDAAEGWGTFDLIGGGLVTDLLKHSRLDDAQNGISYLQVLLGRFHTELADVDISAQDIQAKPGEFLSFADFFFDGLFVDWAVLKHIHGAQENLLEVERTVLLAVDRLIQRQDDLNNQEQNTQEELEQIVLAAS